MASPFKITMVTLLIMAAFTVSHATVYKVGDDSGWHPNFDYAKWACSKKFYVGDTIIFEYNNAFQNVKEVNHEGFRACNASNPKGTYTSGNDTFNLNRAGHRYFVCDLPNHCNIGQKVDIRILQNDTPHQAPNPSPSTWTAPAPAPGSSAASSVHLSKLQIAQLAAMAAFLLAFLI